MTDAFRIRLRAALAAHEGRVHWMYPDGRGNVTIGVGHLLPSATPALKLPLHNSEGKRATLQQTYAAWASVRHTGKPYRELTLTDAAVDALLDQDIDERQPVLDKTFAGVVLPDSPALGLWDILFNTGSFAGWPDLTAAVRAGDWARAAAESKRKEGQDGVSPQRNQDTKQLFLAALQIPIPVETTRSLSA
jgi:GH24 family phage-related lysozyme (muramidase)